MVEVTYIPIAEAKELVRRYTRFAYSNLVDPDKAVSTYRKPQRASFNDIIKEAGNEKS